MNYDWVTASLPSTIEVQLPCIQMRSKMQFVLRIISNDSLVIGQQYRQEIESTGSEDDKYFMFSYS